LARVLKRLHYPLDVIPTCVRWYQCRAGNTHQDPSEKYLNNIVEQGLRAIKRRIRPMLGFEKFGCARILLNGIELMHMVNKGQMKNYFDLRPTPAQQFHS
jgi:transposase-like protein